MLRRALGPASVASRDGGYALEVEADHVDVLAVQRAAATAARLREGGEPEQAADLCGSALRLFRGTPLQVAGDAEWASVPRTRVDEAHTTLLEVRFWARLELGGAGSVIGELEGAVAEHPFHEGLWELLITALYRTGRQADALAAYQRVRTQLGEELGLDPGPALQRLERDILAQEVAGAPVTAASDGSGARAGQPPVDVGRTGRARRRRGGVGRAVVPGAAGRGHRSGRDRQDRGRPRRRPAAADIGRGRRRLAGPAGEHGHPRGRGRRPDRGAARTRQRGRPLRTAPGQLRPRDPRQLRARRGGGRRPRGPAARPRPGPAHPVHQPAPARDRRGTRGRARAPRAVRRGRAVRTSRLEAHRHGARRRARARPVPVPRRPAAGHRARGGAHQDPDRRGDHPSPRRPVQRPEGPRAAVGPSAAGR